MIMKMKRLNQWTFLYRVLLFSVILFPFLVSCKSTDAGNAKKTGSGYTDSTGSGDIKNADAGSAECIKRCEKIKQNCIERCEDYSSFGFSMGKSTSIAGSESGGTNVCTDKCKKNYRSCLDGCGVKNIPEE